MKYRGSSLVIRDVTRLSHREHGRDTPGGKINAVATATLSSSAPALDSPSLYINRELSWLAFNERVLARRATTAIRCSSASGSSSIVGDQPRRVLHDPRRRAAAAAADGHRERRLAGRAVDEQQLTLVRGARAADARAAGARAGPTRSGRRSPSTASSSSSPRSTRTAMAALPPEYFAREISPVLTPLAFDPGPSVPAHLEPQQEPRGGRQARRTDEVRARQAAPVLAAVRRAAGGARRRRRRRSSSSRTWCAPTSQSLFPGTHVKGAHLFRVVRDADLVIQEDEADDLLETIDQGLQQRRHGALACSRSRNACRRRVLDILVENFEIDDDVLVRTSNRLGFGDWMQLTRLPRPELKYPTVRAAAGVAADEADGGLRGLRHRDRLVHHPFQSFSPVETFLRAAVRDPHVIAIKMTLYRIGTDSPLVDLLVEAAEAGKQVAVLVELKARFDERNNIEWANRLEAAGVHVVYGLVNLKTHCKLCLVVRKEADGIRRYAHIGTGNYNAATARALHGHRRCSPRGRRSSRTSPNCSTT